MRRRSRLLRVAKWGGVVVCAVIAITLIVSRWYWIAWTHSQGYVLASGGVATSVWFQPGLGPWTTYYGNGVTLKTTKSGLVAVPSSGPPALRLWIPSYQIWSSDPYEVTVSFPLWVPFIPFAIPTAFLFYRDRRRPRPGHCPCGYDLTGNESGTCPECGRKAAIDGAG